MKHMLLLLWLPAALAAQSPTLERIALYGNTRTKDFVILRELQVKTGFKLTGDLLRRDRAWLLRQNFLKRIEFQMKPGSTLNERILMLVVQEKGWMSISPIVANKDVYGWYAGVRMTTQNVLGFRNTLNATVQLGGLQRYALEWLNPWIGDEYRIFTRLTCYHTAFRYRFRDHEGEFDERDSGFILALGKGFGRRLRIGFELGFEQIWVEDERVTFSSGHDDDLTFITPFLTFDSRDWPAYPRKGFYLYTSIRRFKTSGKYRFRRLTLDGRFYTPVLRDNILAFQSVLHLSEGRVPIYKRIHVGGGRTLRGYSEGALGGENSWLISMEYRIPILYERNPLAGVNAGYGCVLFFDTANTWFGNESPYLKDFQSSAGLGFHAIWDDLVLRAEYGYRGKGLGFINVGSSVKF